MRIPIIFVFCVSASLAQPVLLPPDNNRPRVVEILDRYVVEREGAIHLVAEGRAPDKTWTIARVALPSLRRESRHHRLFKPSPRSPEWIACFRLISGTRSQGCLRRRVQANNHPVPTALPTVHLAFTWHFDTATQHFVITPNPAAELPIPRTRQTPADTYFVPLPLERHTPAVVKRALRAAGATLSPTPDTADVLILPDGADFCFYDRRSQPRTVAPLLPTHRVLWESSLDTLRR